MAISLNPSALWAFKPTEVISVTDSTGAKTKNSAIISVLAVGLAVFLIFCKPRRRKR